MTEDDDRLARRLAELEAENRALRDAAQGVPFGEGLIEREALLSEAERIAHAGSWMWDTRSGVVRWSDELYRILGLAPRSVPPTAEGFFGSIHPDDRARVESVAERGLATGKPEPVEFRIRRPDGAVRDVRMDATVIHDQDGVPLRLVGTVLDNTERRALERQIFHSQRMEAIGTLAGGVAHDFNNYLLVIEGNAELLAQMVPREGAVADSIQEILRACERCTSLTRQLLTVGRKQVFDPRVLDINDVARSVHRMVERVVGDNITVATSLSEHPAKVRADGTQLEQAVLNLVVNARDAMPRGGTLHIETGDVFIDAELAARHPEFHPGPYVRVAVSDDGVGIPPEVLSRAFEPFFTTKAPGKGSGLGLSTVYGIVAQAGGVVTLDSELGKGTTAKIYLPAVESVELAKAEAVEALEAPKGSERVLLVEDQAQVRHLVRTLLERGGYSVLEAEDGAQALEVVAADHGRIDVLLTDVMMPRMGGIELAQRFRHDHPRAAVVFMSGYADRGEGLEGAVVEGTPFLQKPFTMRDLMKAIRRALDEQPRSAALHARS